MSFLAKMEPLQPPMGPPKTQKSQKVPLKGSLFTPSENLLQKYRFLDPPEPRKLSWRLHKTSIFTCRPYPKNIIKMTSQNLPFSSLAAPSSPKVPKRSVSENPQKKHLPQSRKRCQNDLQMGGGFSAFFLLLPSPVSDPAPSLPQTCKILTFCIKNTLFSLYFHSDFLKKKT